jgi:hypothetical protein
VWVVAKPELGEVIAKWRLQASRLVPFNSLQADLECCFQSRMDRVFNCVQLNVSQVVSDIVGWIGVAMDQLKTGVA